MTISIKNIGRTALCASTLALALQAQAGFQVSGTELLDANGNPFIMRGVNHPHAWFTHRTEQSLQDIASVGANSVRVVLADGQQWSRSSAAEVAQIIDWAKDNQLITILEVHDATGYPESEGAGTLANVVDYWLDIASVLEGQEDYVIINIANEPFGNNVPASTWVDEHIDAIQRLRDAGLTHTLMVDAANWGQDWEGIMQDHASTVAAADELNNTMFSVHMYEVYQDRSSVENYISDFLNTHGLPIIVGEFGADHYGNPVDAESILAVSEEYNTGYLGWSWSGNSSEVDALDITIDWDVNNLSSWGDFLINSSNGLLNTAQTASVFTDGGASSSSSEAASSSSAPASSSSAPASSSASASSEPVSGQQCNWYGTEYPICEDTDSGWGWEDNQSCIALSDCQGQPDPYGVVGEESSASSSQAQSSVASSVSSSASSQHSSTQSSEPPMSIGGCEYVITNDWGSGYTGAIRIHNEGDQAINGWSVSWAYEDGTTITNSWNAEVSGSNPYTAGDMGWNADIQPGETVEFGFQAATDGQRIGVPDLSGSACSGQP